MKAKNKGLSYKERQKKGWEFRVKNEMHNSIVSNCVIINYDIEKCPKTMSGIETLNKRDIQLYIKRIRKNVLSDRIIKYYCYGGYDQQSGVPYYNIIFFNVARKDIERNWSIGEIKYDHSNHETIKKVLERESMKDIKDEQEKPFTLNSKGLGSNYLNEIPLEIKRSGVSILKLHHRYYTEKLGYTKNHIKDENLRKKVSLLGKKIIANKQIISRKKNQIDVLEKGINKLILMARKGEIKNPIL